MNHMDNGAIPYFSICIPVYNVEQYLVECIDSVLNQTLTDYEVILIDDGSQDKSPAICNMYAAKYPAIRVIHKQNEGPLLARYDAIKMAKGQYLLFLDSDDVFSPVLLEKVQRKIRQFHADLVIFDWYRFYADGHQQIDTLKYLADQCFEKENKIQIYEDIVLESFLNNLWSKCVKRSLFSLESNIDQYKGMKQGEDKFASLPLIDKAEKIVYLKEPLYGYRMNDASTTHNVRLTNYQDVRIVHKRVQDYIKRWNLSSEIKNRQQASTVRFALQCIRSLSDMEIDGKNQQNELREAINYISSDEMFLSAFDVAYKELSFRQKIEAKLIKSNSKSAIMYFNAKSRFKKLVRRYK